MDIPIKMLLDYYRLMLGGKLIMIQIENTEVMGWEAAIRGMRNPMNSWDRSDSERKYESWHDMSGGEFTIGPNDHDLMMRLAAGGPVHTKYRRMITV